MTGVEMKGFFMARTSDCELSYEAGDRLLFVTDQIGGPQNPRAYGYRRMQEVFSNSVGSSAAAVVQALEHSVREWQGAQVRRDDVTILCVDLCAGAPTLSLAADVTCGWSLNLYFVC